MRKIILATTNPHKIQKLTWIMNDYFDIVEPQSQDIDVEETENNFEGNAILKAVTISKRYNCHAVATDGGVLIPSLGNNWNAVLTKRFLEKDTVTDFDRIEGLLKLMQDKRGDERKIMWNEALAIAYKGKLLFSTQVDGDEGMVQTTYNPKHYAAGIWQCTITCYPQFGNKNYFELSDAEREYSEISWHRLKQMVDWYVKGGTTPSRAIAARRVQKSVDL